MKTSRWTILVEITALVHGLLQRVTLPSENIVTMGCGTTVARLDSSIEVKSSYNLLTQYSYYK